MGEERIKLVTELKQLLKEQKNVHSSIRFNIADLSWKIVYKNVSVESMTYHRGLENGMSLILGLLEEIRNDENTI